MLTAAVLPNTSQAASGDLDPSFGTGGVAILSIGVHSYANAVAIQDDGKIVVAGYVYTSGPSGDMAVVRLDSTGALDAGFGTGGVVTLDAGNKQSLAYALAIQPDGKIVVGGGVFVTPDTVDYDFRVARLLPADGALDSGFGTGGEVMTPAAGTIGVTSLALQPDGKIVAGGDGKKKVTARNPNRDFMVARYLGDGTPDASFGVSGRTTLSMGKRADAVRRVLPQPDGRIVLAGYAVGPGRGSMAIARLATDGSLDHSFGGGGRRKLRLFTRLESANDAALLADGRILAAGGSVDPTSFIPVASATLARLMSSGSLDGTFGTEGASTVAPDPGAYHQISRIALQTDGSIVAAGSAIRGSGSPTSPDILLMRFLPGGTLDTSFGTGGVVRTSFTDHDELFAVALQTDGRIVVAGLGVVAGQSRIIVARYLP